MLRNPVVIFQVKKHVRTVNTVCSQIEPLRYIKFFEDLDQRSIRGPRSIWEPKLIENLR